MDTQVFSINSNSIQKKSLIHLTSIFVTFFNSQIQLRLLRVDKLAAVFKSSIRVLFISFILINVNGKSGRCPIFQLLNFFFIFFSDFRTIISFFIYSIFFVFLKMYCLRNFCITIASICAKNRHCQAIKWFDF